MGRAPEEEEVEKIGDEEGVEGDVEKEEVTEKETESAGDSGEK